MKLEYILYQNKIQEQEYISTKVLRTFIYSDNKTAKKALREAKKMKICNEIPIELYAKEIKKHEPQ